MWWFISGLFVGASVTIIIMSALIMGSKSDDHSLGESQYEENH